MLFFLFLLLFFFFFFFFFFLLFAHKAQGNQPVNIYTIEKRAEGVDISTDPTQFISSHHTHLHSPSSTPLLQLAPLPSEQAAPSAAKPANDSERSGPAPFIAYHAWIGATAGHGFRPQRPDNPPFPLWRSLERQRKGSSGEKEAQSETHTALTV